jgi:hypothetical protein
MANEDARPAQDDARVPVVIGVTGHRDLREQDRSQLTEAVSQIFRDLGNDYPQTPLIIVSPLAEGADRLVARVALEAGARLIVPLPMPQHLYEDDFATPLSRAEFRDLLQRADHSFELPPVEGDSPANIRVPGHPRNLQYEQVGKYIARQSQILIALWDGLDKDLVGGTAAIVRFQREGIPDPAASPVEPPECFPVYHILTPRLSNPEPEPKGEQKPFDLKVLYPPAFEKNERVHEKKGKEAEDARARAREKAEQYYRRIFGRMETFNAYVSGGDPALPAEIEQSKNYLLSGLKEEDIPQRFHRALYRYAAADALAIRFQRQTENILRRLHWIVFAAFAVFIVFAHSRGTMELLPKWRDRLGEHPVGLLLVSLVLVLWAYLLARAAKNEELDTKYQDYRALAEGLRVKFFWRMAGILESVADHYLGKQRTELDWIRNGFRGWNLGEERVSAAPSAALLGIDLVLKHWVEDQHSYFRRTSNRQHNLAEHGERRVSRSLKSAFLVGGILAMGLIGCRLGCPVLRQIETNPAWTDLLIIVIDVLLAAAALIHHYCDRMAYTEHAKQYGRMEKIFAYSSMGIKSALHGHDADRAHTILVELGKEALAENGDWVLLHRERPLELPHP